MPIRRRAFTARAAGGVEPTTCPDDKPAPFTFATQAGGVDRVTVVTEGSSGHGSFKVKIDIDRRLGPEQANGAAGARWSAM